ncbi:hypothetical protein DFH94DRAFT_679932 [Russula ochroleuca]|uniref:Uncharacterized protein n=1 Tax=Russula ochroleuca TaxID=152965 RepID=A0A9P5N0J1_9AGAM|nr:hypothetical protein DFH94DRAFT_679932 [Russula ochroleuca]
MQPNILSCSGRCRPMPFPKKFQFWGVNATDDDASTDWRDEDQPGAFKLAFKLGFHGIQYRLQCPVDSVKYSFNTFALWYWYMRALRFPFKRVGSAVTGDVDGPMLDSVVVEVGVIVVSMFTVMPSLLSSPSRVRGKAASRANGGVAPDALIPQCVVLRGSLKEARREIGERSLRSGTVSMGVGQGCERQADLARPISSIFCIVGKK